MNLYVSYVPYLLEQKSRKKAWVKAFNSVYFNHKGTTYSLNMVQRTLYKVKMKKKFIFKGDIKITTQPVHYAQVKEV